MKALVYTGVETLDYRDVAHPTVPEGSALVQIRASGICGSDMHAYLGHDERRPAPLILGHEAAGIVVEGPDVGRSVVINPLVTCGTCSACQAGKDNLCPNRQIISMPPREGAFADYVAMPLENLISVPDGVALDHAALTEPLACGWHAVRIGIDILKVPSAGLRCLAIGGGAIGLGAALAMQAQGVGDVTVVEAHPDRRAFLQENTDLTVLSPDDLEGIAPFDLVVDGVGFSATRATASAVVRPGGVITHIGLGENTGGLDIRRMTLQEITFVGTYTYTMDDFRATAQAIFEGRFGALNWVAKRPLSEGAAAFADIRAGRTAAPKTILIPDHEPGGGA